MDRIEPPSPPPEDPFDPSNGFDPSLSGSSGSTGAPRLPAGDAGVERFAVDGVVDGAALRQGPICRICPLRSSCRAICEVVEALLPSPERGRVDAEDLPRLFSGIRMRRALLDMSHILTERQQEVVRLYYRESLQQHEIASLLGVSQQAVHDSLRRARKTVGEKILHEGRTAPTRRRPGRPLDS
ncbi:MAG: sigma factor-like helix-turn-helix DNA-binding protein [Planctomycetota bacterium]|jgi:predicted DNA-binding protein (UPF0251 family)